jgi:hypothetical protein
MPLRLCADTLLLTFPHCYRRSAAMRQIGQRCFSICSCVRAKLRAGPHRGSASELATRPRRFAHWSNPGGSDDKKNRK